MLNDKTTGKYEDVIMPHFKVLLQNLSEGTKKTIKNVSPSWDSNPELPNNKGVPTTTQQCSVGHLFNY